VGGGTGHGGGVAVKPERQQRVGECLCCWLAGYAKGGVRGGRVLEVLGDTAGIAATAGCAKAA